MMRNFCTAVSKTGCAKTRPATVNYEGFHHLRFRKTAKVELSIRLRGLRSTERVETPAFSANSAIVASGRIRKYANIFSDVFSDELSAFSGPPWATICALNVTIKNPERSSNVGAEAPCRLHASPDGLGSGGYLR